MVRELLEELKKLQAPSKAPKVGSLKKPKTSVGTGVVEERREESSKGHADVIQQGLNRIKELEKELHDAPSAKTLSS